MPPTISGSLETRFSWTYSRAAGARQHAHTTCRANEVHSLAIAPLLVCARLAAYHSQAHAAYSPARLYLLWLHLLSYTYYGYTR